MARKKSPDLENPLLYNKEAERQTLGLLLKSEQLLPEAIAELLHPEDFVDRENGLIYKAMLRLCDRGERIGQTGVTSALNVRAAVEPTNSETLIAELVSEARADTGAATWAERVRQCSLRRKLATIGNNVLRDAHSSENPERVLTNAQYALSQASPRSFREEMTRLNVVSENNQESLQNQYARGTMLTGLPTGFRRLNALTLGYQKGDLIIVGGLPGMGKTAFALNLAAHLSVRNTYSVAFFSLESTKDQIGFRIQCLEAGVNLYRLREGRISKEDKAALFYAAERMRDARLYICDTPALTIQDLYARALQLQKRQGIDLLVLDHLGLMGPRGRNGATSQRVGSFSYGLKRLAVELGIPVMALCQLSGNSARTAREPRLSDLPGAGRVGQNADAVIFLHRPEYHDPETDEKNICRLIIAKQRNGPVETFSLGWLSEHTKFMELAQIQSV